jgi:CRISPR-associated protein Csm2
MENLKVIFYSDPENKVLNYDLFSNHADQWAIRICSSGLKTKFDQKTKKEKKVLEKNKISQIRKFYDEVLRFSEYLKAGEDYKSILPYIKMLNAKAAYAEGRKLVTEDFKDFIKQTLAYLDDDPNSFKIFVSFFEAFMGYYKFYESQYKTESEG